MWHRKAVPLLFVAIALAVPACSSDPADPTPEPLTAAELLGAYTATTFTVDFGSGPENMLSGGASIQITLQANGETTERVFAPDAGEEGGDFDESLAGTWILQGVIVELDHDADTFLRDMPFTATKGGGVVRLGGSKNFGDETIHVVLVKS